MFDKDRLKRIKLIVADLDGTLLNNAGNISGKTKELISKLQELGVIFSFASGRLDSAMLDLAKELNIKAPVISLDGSLIRTFPNGKIIFQSHIPVKYVKKVLGLADKFLLNIALCHAEAIYFTERNSTIPQLMPKFGAKYTEVVSYENYFENVLEIAIASNYKDNIKYVHDRMNFPYTFGLNTSYFKSINNHGIYYLEIRNNRANKGKSLIKLTKHLKINLKETAVIGDWYNDISLFHPKALKVTLINSIPELRKLADIIVNKDNNEEGAAEFLEMVWKAKA